MSNEKLRGEMMLAIFVSYYQNATVTIFSAC